jgi:hypothetical protein
MDKRRKEMERMAKLYMEYLNSPFGERVMGGLEEGESFSIHSSYESMKVTKKEGKAIVQVEEKYKSRPGEPDLSAK